MRSRSKRDNLTKKRAEPASCQRCRQKRCAFRLKREIFWFFLPTKHHFHASIFSSSSPIPRYVRRRLYKIISNAVFSPSDFEHPKHNVFDASAGTTITNATRSHCQQSHLTWRLSATCLKVLSKETWFKSSASWRWRMFAWLRTRTRINSRDSAMSSSRLSKSWMRRSTSTDASYWTIIRNHWELTLPSRKRIG